MEQVRTQGETIPSDQEGFDRVFAEMTDGMDVEWDGDALDTLESVEETAGPEVQELFRVAAPEGDSNPQLDWPESDAAGHISERDYSLRLNYRLSVAGFILDAARAHIESEQDADTWLELKRVVYEAKSNDDVYSKVDVVIALEELVYDFALRLNTTDAEYQAARSGN